METKVFNGSRYTFYQSFFKKTEAEKIAKRLRKTGRKVRVTAKVWGNKKMGGKVTDYIIWTGGLK